MRRRVSLSRHPMKNFFYHFFSVINSVKIIKKIKTIYFILYNSIFLEYFLSNLNDEFKTIFLGKD